jgi:hypothetical protein
MANPTKFTNKGFDESLVLGQALPSCYIPLPADPGLLQPKGCLKAALRSLGRGYCQLRNYFATIARELSREHHFLGHIACLAQADAHQGKEVGGD